MEENIHPGWLNTSIAQDDASPSIAKIAAGCPESCGYARLNVAVKMIIMLPVRSVLKSSGQSSPPAGSGLFLWARLG
jgi:hypothetical protein